jgi:hypothetical protein
MTKRRFKDDDDDDGYNGRGANGGGGNTRAAVQAAVQAATAAAAAARGAAAAAAAAASAGAATTPTLPQPSPRPPSGSHHHQAAAAGAAISELPSDLSSALRQGGTSSSLRSALDALVRNRRLALLIDVDACLLDAASVSDLSRDEEAAVDRASRGEAAAGVPPEARSLQWQQPPNGAQQQRPPPYWLKLRPGARRFLRQASERFELWAAVASPAASAVLGAVGPSGALFGARVLNLALPSDASVLRALEDRAPAALVLGDGATMSALAAAAAAAAAAGGGGATTDPEQTPLAALLPIERYAFFGATRRRERLPGPSLAELAVDEDPERGALANALRCLERAHATALDRARRAAASSSSSSDLESWDARRVLADERKRVLAGCVLAFDPRVLSAGAGGGDAAQQHPLWRLAEQHGAACAEAPAAAALPAGLTHLVAAHGGTERASAARAVGAAVVSAAWVEHACLAWRLPVAERFAPPP